MTDSWEFYCNAEYFRNSDWLMFAEFKKSKSRKKIVVIYLPIRTFLDFTCCIDRGHPSLFVLILIKVNKDIFLNYKQQNFENVGRKDFKNLLLERVR